jgi:hypothetical protein
VAKTLYLHLGLHKTATGWLQRQFFPRLGLPLYRTRKLDRIAALAAGSEADRIIVSHEGLGGKISDDKAPGDSLRIFAETLAGLGAVEAETRLVLGFREHVSWVGSAYAQRGKKTAVTPEQYRATYSLDDLDWMKRVRLCDESGFSPFLFLYEEFASDPIALCEDLCRFLDVAMPDDVPALLAQRENPSPRSERGLRIARGAQNVARVLGALPFLDAKKLRAGASAFGARFDTDEPRIEIRFPDDELRRLNDDWRALSALIAERRGKNEAAYLTNFSRREGLA